MAAIAAVRRHRPGAGAAVAWTALAAYVALGALLLPQFATLIFKDEVVYLAAAERYARGEAAAPNAYWGPLTSWLLAPLLLLGVRGAEAARLVALALGAVTLVGARRLAESFELPAPRQALLAAMLVPCLLYFALRFLSADLPLAALLTFYFAALLDPRYAERRWAGALCGLLGALGYFAKGYALPFFLLHFTLTSIIHLLARPQPAARRAVLRHYAAGMAVFAVLAAGWVATLHCKYGVVTTGLTGKYNWEIVGPRSEGRPILHMGFAAPPPSTTVSIWEDPWYFYDLPEARACCLKPWSPLESREAMGRQAALIADNLRRTANLLNGFSVAAIGVAGAALVYLGRAGWQARRGRGGLRRALILAERTLGSADRLRLALFVLTLGAYAMPYTLVYADERYLWPLLPLIAVVGLRLLEMAAAAGLPARPWPQAILAGAFAVSFLPIPLGRMTHHVEARREMSVFERALAPAGLAGARVASQNDYGSSMIIAYHVGAKYYGQPRPGASDATIAEDLRRRGVGYYFVWNEPPGPRPGMDLRHVIEIGPRSLAVYALRPNAPG